MGLFINTNVASLRAQTSLMRSSARLEKNFQRLSSGLRINTAGDDAAGLAISSRFESQVRGLNQAMRNANDGISLAQVTEGALQEDTNILQRMRELAVQAASDVNSQMDRRSIQAEISQLVSELDRIATTTVFNQQRLLDGSFVEKQIHTGMNFRETIRMDTADTRAINLGRWAVQTGVPVTTDALTVGGLTINGITIRQTQGLDDSVSASYSNGSAIAKATAINTASEFTGVNAYINPTVRSDSLATPLDAIDGGVLDANNFITINGVVITGFTVQQDDRDDALIRAINGDTERHGVFASRDSNGFIELRAEDGRNIRVAASTIAAANATGLIDPANPLLRTITTATLTLHSEDQFVLGGGQESFVGFTLGQTISVGETQAVSTMDVTSRDGANIALLIADRALDQVSLVRSQLGAVVNRLETTISNLNKVSENASAAKSRIIDADFAVETAELTKNQILQQASTAVLAQANTSPQIALSLLQQ